MKLYSLAAPVFFAACTLGDSSITNVGASPLPSDDGQHGVARSAAENGHEHVGERVGVRLGAPTSHARHVGPLVQTFEDGREAPRRDRARHGLEGIVSKRKASAYRSGPSRDWVKIKTAAWRVVGQFENRR